MQHETNRGSLISYISGFVLSIVLTLAAYFIVSYHVHSDHEILNNAFLIFSIIALALIQLAVQLVCFLHIWRDSKPHWNLIVFAYAFLLVVIIVGGSLWIMYHLNYNMMHMPPAEVDHYMLDQ
jgi:cytochrome o ubiquinol oxidase operon protein cyoD